MSIRCFSRFFLLSSIVNILARSNLLLIRILHFWIFFINHILPWSIVTIHIHLRLLIWCSTITRGWRLDYSFWDVLTSSISIYWWLILVWLGLGDNWRCVLVLYNFSWADVFIRVDLLIGVWLDLTPQILLVYIRSRYSLIPIIHSIFVHLNIRIVCCCGLARTCRLVGNYWLLLYLCLSQPIIIATSSVNTIPIPLLLWSNLSCLWPLSLWLLITRRLILISPKLFLSFLLLQIRVIVLVLVVCSYWGFGLFDKARAGDLVD